MHPINVMIKPASASCNLRCKYCFYADEAAIRQVPNYGKMSRETLEEVVRLFMQNARGSCTFAFQGGEPTLAGLDFFEDVVRLEQKYSRPGLRVTNALQTNGMVIDADWCRFLAKNHFLVGLSMDGVKQTHDLYRQGPGGAGSFAQVQRAAQLMTQHGVEFNILTVVTRQLAKNITTVYNSYIKRGYLYHQYIPCMDALESQRGGEEYSLTPKEYGEFLKKLFDLWFNDLRRGFVVSVRYFDNLMMMLNGRPPESCAMAGHCNVQYLVEADGSVFPCDFYALDAFRLGRIPENTLEELDQKRKEIRFIEDSLQKPAKCQACPWLALCRGGCRRDCVDGPASLNYYCESYREFFAYAAPRLRQAADFLARTQPGMFR